MVYIIYIPLFTGFYQHVRWWWSPDCWTINCSEMSWFLPPFRPRWMQMVFSRQWWSPVPKVGLNKRALPWRNNKLQPINQPTHVAFFKVTFQKKFQSPWIFVFWVMFFYGLYRKSAFFTTVWEKIFGTFLKATYVNPFQTLNQHTSATHSSTKQPTTIININI